MKIMKEYGNGLMVHHAIIHQLAFVKMIFIGIEVNQIIGMMVRIMLNYFIPEPSMTDQNLML